MKRIQSNWPPHNISSTSVSSITWPLITSSHSPIVLQDFGPYLSAFSDVTTAHHTRVLLSITRFYYTPIGGFSEDNFIGYQTSLRPKVAKETSGASIEKYHPRDRIVGSGPNLTTGKGFIGRKKRRILGSGDVKKNRDKGSSERRGTAASSIGENSSNMVDGDGYDDDLNKILGPFTQYIKTKKRSDDRPSSSHLFDSKSSATTESYDCSPSPTDGPSSSADSYNPDITTPDPKVSNNSEESINQEAPPLFNYHADIRMLGRNNGGEYRSMRDRYHRKIDESNCHDHDVIKEYRPFQKKREDQRLERSQESESANLNEHEADLPHHRSEEETEKLRKRTRTRNYINQPNISQELVLLTKMEPEEKEERAHERWKLHKREKKWSQNALSDDIETHQAIKRKQSVCNGISESTNSTSGLIQPEKKTIKEQISIINATPSSKEIRRNCDLPGTTRFDTVGDDRAAKEIGRDNFCLIDDDVDGKGKDMFSTQLQELISPSPSTVPVGHIQYYIQKGPQLLADDKIQQLEAEMRDTIERKKTMSDGSTVGETSVPTSEDTSVLNGECYSDMYEPYIPVDDKHRPQFPRGSSIADSIVDQERIPYTPSSELLSHAEIAKVMNESVLHYFTNVVEVNIETDARKAAGEELVQEEKAVERSQSAGVVSPQTTVFSSELEEYEKNFLAQWREDRSSRMYNVPSGVMPAPTWRSSDISSPLSILPEVQHAASDTSAAHIKQESPISSIDRDIPTNLSTLLYRPSDYIPLDDNYSIFDGVLCGKDTFEEVETGVGANGKPVIVRRRVLRTGLSPTGRDGVIGQIHTSHPHQSSVSSTILSKRRKLMNRAIGGDEVGGPRKESCTDISYLKNYGYFSEGMEINSHGDHTDQSAHENVHFPTNEEEEVRERNRRLESYMRFMKLDTAVENCAASDNEVFSESTEDVSAIKGSTNTMISRGPELVTDDEAYELAMDFFTDAASRRYGSKDDDLVLSSDSSDKPLIDLDKEKKRAPHLNLSTNHKCISTVLQKDADSMLPPFHPMRGRKGPYTSDLAIESENTILVRQRAEGWWDDKLTGKLKDDITEYNEALEEASEDYLQHTDGMVDATVTHHNMSGSIRHYEMKYNKFFPRNERIQEEYVTISRVIPNDGGKLTMIPPENRIKIRTGEARRIAKSLGLDLIKTRNGGMGDRRETHAECQIADHRYDKREFIAFHIRKMGFKAVKTREPREMSFRGTSHPHAIWFKSVGVAKIIYQRHPVIVEMDNFGSIREGMAAFQSVLDEIKKQCTKLDAFHTCGPVKAEYDRISCTLYPSTTKSPKTSIIHPTVKELRTVRDHRILEQDKDMYHEDLLEANRLGGGKNLVRYMMALRKGTAWAWKDEGLSIKRQRDIKRIYGWLPKGNGFYAGRGDVELDGPKFRARTPQTVEQVSYPRVSNLEQAERGFAVIQNRYDLPISEMHDNNETEENESTISRFYSRMSGDAMQIGDLKKAFGLKSNRRKLPLLPSGSWATLGVDDEQNGK